MSTKNKITLAVVGIIGVAAIGFVASRSGGNSQVATNTGIYCSPDGTFTNTAPVQNYRSYCVRPDRSGTNYQPNTPQTYSFSIIDDQGNTLKDFATTHTKIMHVIVVRKDLAEFQHLHPDFNPQTGIFTLSNLVFPTDGQYRIFANFSPAGQMGAMENMAEYAPFHDVNVGNLANYTPQPLGATDTIKTFEGMDVTIYTHPTPPSTGSTTILGYLLNINGKPVVDLQSYLGALGHAVILREGDLEFIHAHPIEDVTKPQSGVVHFVVDYPEAGMYKVFTQFQRQGKVVTTDFVLNVVQGTASSTQDTNSMPGMDMGMPGMKM